jgi:hypothetical protein
VKEVVLPDGTTADLYEAKDMTRGEKRDLDDLHLKAMGKSAKYLTAMAGVGEDASTWGDLDKITADEKHAADQWVCASILVRLVSWTRSDDIPKTQEEWDAYRPGEVYDILAAEVLADRNEAEEEHTADGADDPKAPSDGSTSSTPGEEDSD